MSDQTRQALADAIAAHVQDEHPGELPGAWILATQTLTLDGEDSAARFEAEGSTLTTVGLAHAYLDTTHLIPDET